MYVYVCGYKFVYKCVNMCMYMYMCVCSVLVVETFATGVEEALENIPRVAQTVGVYVCLYVCMYMFVGMNMCVRVDMCECLYMYTYVYICVCIRHVCSPSKEQKKSSFL